MKPFIVGLPEMTSKDRSRSLVRLLGLSVRETGNVGSYFPKKLLK